MDARDRIRPGITVILLPLTGGIPDGRAENPRLWGARGTVDSVHQWGAVVAPESGGQYRAAWAEMVPLDPGDDSDRPAELPVRHSLSASGHHNGVERARPAAARDMGYTGDSCPRCQGMRMKRNGACQVCEDCGESGGCG